MSDAFVARFSPWRRGAAVLLCAGFVAVSLWEAGALGTSGPRVPVIGWAGAAVFAFFGAVGLRRLLTTGPAVRVDGDGIWLWRAGGGIAVPWRAILAIDERSVNRQRFLCLQVDDPDRYRARGWLGRVNGGMGFADISVGLQATDRRFDELLAAVERFAGGAR